MKLALSFCLCLALVCGCLSPCGAQTFSLSEVARSTGLAKEGGDGISSLNSKALSFLQKKYTKLSQSVEKQSQKALLRMEKKERKLRQALPRKDSLSLPRLFPTEVSAHYRFLQQNLRLPPDSLTSFPLHDYIPNIDSIQTALRFLAKEAALPSQQLTTVKEDNEKLLSLQAKLQKGSEAEAFMRDREERLRTELAKSGLARKLKSLNKEAFYYGQRMRGYKERLTSPGKAEEKLLGAVRNSRLFTAFMQKHSYLAKLFPTPAGYGTPEALAGLQTRASVSAALSQRFGTPATGSSNPPGVSGAGSAESYLQRGMAAAQSELGKLKEKMDKFGIKGGGTAMTMPLFTPNTQHTKSFLQRLQYGINVQSEGAKGILPSTSEGALTLGYKLNDKSTLGIGTSYRMGWGHEGFKHITITNEGIGLRSYVDIRAKGSFWLSGGYEMNYLSSFEKLRQLYNITPWQRSGLIGLTKKYKVGKKENNMQLLWDFLSYREVPRAPAIKFRVGFGL